MICITLKVGERFSQLLQRVIRRYINRNHALETGAIHQDPMERLTTPQLWFAHADDLLEEDSEQACLAMLSSEERTRVARFRFDRNRREYVATHTLLRIALAHNRQPVTEDSHFHVNKYGKPALDCVGDLRFNLSHCEGLAVCLLARGAEVGVDAEPRASSNQAEKLASKIFSPVEIVQLERLQAEAKPDRALSLWVLKEAYIKARGFGLSLPLQDISFVFSAEGTIRLETEASVDSNAARWRFCLTEYSKYKVAAMFESQTCPQDLEIRVARLPNGDSMRLDLQKLRWY